MSIGSVGSSILGADLSSFLKLSQSSNGITPQSPDGEVTTQTKNGDLVTTIGQGQDANVVSVTSPSGTTLTEVGYVSPVLVQKFLDSLEQALQTDGTGGGSTASTPGVAANADAATGLASSIQALLKQLDSNGASGSPGSGLATTFSGLLQSSGIAAGSGGTPGDGARTALQAFLSHALSQLNPAGSSSLGSTVDAIA